MPGSPLGLISNTRPWTYLSELTPRVSPAVDINRTVRRLALTPVVVEAGNAGQFRQCLFVDPLPSGAGSRFLREDGERSVADDFRSAPLRSIRHAPVDGCLGLDNRARPERVCRYVVGAMLFGETDGEPRHALLRNDVR